MFDQGGAGPDSGLLSQRSGRVTLVGSQERNFPHMAKKFPRLHVLIIDDEPLIRWSMAETLANEGHSIAEARDGKETLEKLSVAPLPDVIFLDYRLPDSNNLKLLEAIRRVVPGSPVVMMTAFGSSEVIADAERLGAFRVLSKPLEMRDLVQLVQQAYSSRSHSA